MDENGKEKAAEDARRLERSILNLTKALGSGGAVTAQFEARVIEGAAVCVAGGLGVVGVSICSEKGPSLSLVMEDELLDCLVEMCRVSKGREKSEILKVSEQN